jgi:hypothetical protein
MPTVVAMTPHLPLTEYEIWLPYLFSHLLWHLPYLEVTHFVHLQVSLVFSISSIHLIYTLCAPPVHSAFPGIEYIYIHISLADTPSSHPNDNDCPGLFPHPLHLSHPATTSLWPGLWPLHPHLCQWPWPLHHPPPPTITTTSLPHTTTPPWPPPNHHPLTITPLPHDHPLTSAHCPYPWLAPSPPPLPHPLYFVL